MSSAKLAQIPTCLFALCLGGCGLAALAKGGLPMGGFPAPIRGEVDAILSEAKVAFESDFPSAKVLRVESLQRTFDPIMNELDQPIGRTAVLDFGIQVGGKCYVQPRRVGQSRTPSGYAGVKLEAQPWAESFQGKGNQGADYYKVEKLSGLGQAWPLDCAQMNADGPRFVPCPNMAGNVLCEQ